MKRCLETRKSRSYFLPSFSLLLMMEYVAVSFVFFKMSNLFQISPLVGSVSCTALDLAVICSWLVVLPHSRACDPRLLTTDARSRYFIRLMSCMAHSYFLAPRSPTYDCTPKILPPFTILFTMDRVCAGVRYTTTSLRMMLGIFLSRILNR